VELVLTDGFRDSDYLENGWAMKFQTNVLVIVLGSFILIILIAKEMERTPVFEKVVYIGD
jgi:hypothetical protein